MFNFLKTDKKSFGGLFKMNCYSKFEGENNSSKFLSFYNQNSAVATAIKLVADNVASIPFIVRQGDKFDYKHEALKLLKKPNPYTTGDLFEKELVANYLLTGNNYLNTIGSNKPLELYNLNPAAMNIQGDSKGYPYLYQYNSGTSSLQFKLMNGVIQSSESSKLDHLRNYNPKYGYSNFYGVSELKGCELEIWLYILANEHNYSVLKNQARPSGLITYKGSTSLSEDQISGIIDSLRSNLSGSDNAGKATFLSGDFDWVQLSESMKDMDFATLCRRTSEAVYNSLKIPLPMVSPDNMTLANMDTARLNLYDNCVVPLKQIVCQYLTAALAPFYKNQIEITFDPSEIQALKPREVANAVDLSKIGALTRDEIRDSLGYPALGGVAGSEIVGSKQPTSTEAKSFLSSLSSDKGERIYSDDFIKNL